MTDTISDVLHWITEFLHTHSHWLDKHFEDDFSVGWVCTLSQPLSNCAKQKTIY